MNCWQHTLEVPACVWFYCTIFVFIHCFLRYTPIHVYCLFVIQISTSWSFKNVTFVFEYISSVFISQTLIIIKGERPRWGGGGGSRLKDYFVDEMQWQCSSLPPSVVVIPLAHFMMIGGCWGQVHMRMNKLLQFGYTLHYRYKTGGYPCTGQGVPSYWTAPPQDWTGVPHPQRLDRGTPGCKHSCLNCRTSHAA